MPIETELYDILEVQYTASEIDIKKAYRKLAIIHHPDKGGDVEQFKKIQGAYDILKDQEKRELYDKYGKDGLSKNNMVSDDFLGAMFSNLFGGQTSNMFNMFKNAFTKTQPTIHKYAISLEDLCQRKVKQLRFTRDRICPCVDESKLDNCTNCNGQGFIRIRRQIGPGMIQQTNNPCQNCSGCGKMYPSCDKCTFGIRKIPKIFSIHLNPELPNGYKYVFKDEGDQKRGGQPGDFIVIILYKLHDVFKLDGINLLYTHNITLKDALCGHVININHPSGETLQIPIQDIVNTTTKKIIDGHGLTDKGDLIIDYNITFPESLSMEQRREIGKNLP